MTTLLFYTAHYTVSGCRFNNARPDFNEKLEITLKFKVGHIMIDMLFQFEMFLFALLHMEIICDKIG